MLYPRGLAAVQGFSGRALLASTMKLQDSGIFLRKLCLLLVGACIAGPPKMQADILGIADTANAGRASPAPTMKSRNSAKIYKHSLAAHCRGGALLHPRGLAAAQGFAGRAMLAHTIESQKSDIFFRKLCLFLVGACIAGPLRVREDILGFADTANAGRASPAPYYEITK